MRWPTDQRGRLLAAGGVIVGGLVLLGVLQGVIWAQVAPGQQAKVYANGAYGSLPMADYHPFTGLAIFVLAGIAVGLVAAAAAWRVRAIRGTTTLLALFLGASAGAAVAFGVGLLLATGVDPASIGATGHESIVVAPPKLATPLVLVAEPAAAVVVYTFLVAWDGRPDLGRLRPTEQSESETPGAEPGPGGTPAVGIAAGGQSSPPDPTSGGLSDDPGDGPGTGTGQQ